MPDHPPARFLTLQQVADELATSEVQVRSLVKRGELKGIQIGGRRQWRVERVKLEEYIQRAYAETAEWLSSGDEPVRDVAAGEDPQE